MVTDTASKQIAKVVIPARLGSTRMREKPLSLLLGKPLIVHAYERAVEAVGADNVWVAVDHERVARAVEFAGGRAVMTRADHESGTDRVAEVADTLSWSDDDIVVNLQGDEPMMPPDLVCTVAEVVADKSCDMATLAANIRRSDDITNPAVVKVITGSDGRALYFSRAPIPHVRDGNPHDSASAPFLRHIGLYAYRVKTLAQLKELPRHPLEEAEKLEQLRALAAGLSIQVGVVKAAPPHGVDTPEMLRAVESRMRHAAAGRTV